MKKLFTLVAVALMAVGASAQQTYILDFNKIYDEASNATGQCTNATLSSGSKYLLNETTYTQDIFTVVSKADRTYRIDLFNPDKTEEVGEYGDYTAKARLEPNGASNSTGGRQMFVEVTNAGTLTIGAWTGTTGRTLYVLPAEDKVSQVKPDAVTPLLSVALDAEAEKTALYTVDLEPGLYCISQDAGIYFAYVKFVEGGSTGINSVNVEKENANAPMYNLSVNVEKENANAPMYNLAGQRVNNNAKGIVIQNGKKFIKK